MASFIIAISSKIVRIGLKFYIRAETFLNCEMQENIKCLPYCGEIENENSRKTLIKTDYLYYTNTNLFISKLIRYIHAFMYPSNERGMNVYLSFAQL